MLKATRWFLVLHVCWWCSSVSAGLIEYRAEVQASYGTGTGTRIEQESGGINDTSASILLESPFSDTMAMASSSLSATGFAPTLKARAVASPVRSQAVAWGVQGYTNTASTALSTSLIMNLTAEITGNNDLDARMYLFKDENFQYYRDSGTIKFESTSELWDGFESFANGAGATDFNVLIGNFTGIVDETRTFDFIVAPGDSFYVWSQLIASADQAGEVDAFSTLTASFTNTQGLQPAAFDTTSSSPVPEPSNTILLGLGVIGLMLVRLPRVLPRTP